MSQECPLERHHRPFDPVGCEAMYAVGWRPYVTWDLIFRVSWLGEAEGGYCDAWGGAECRRVYREWVLSGRELPVTEFINDHAR